MSLVEMDGIGNIYNGDSNLILDELIKDGVVVDIIITSPPYNVDLGNNKYNKNPYSLYRDNKEHHEYIEWLVGIFGKCYDLLEEGGRLCINIGDGKNGTIPTHSDLIQNLTSRFNFILSANIIWNKKNTSNRTAWGSWMKPSCPSYPTTFEYILIFSKNSKKLTKNGETDVTKEEFIKFANSLWEFPGETKKVNHPAPFPKELPKRLIKMNTYKEALVLDPFMGSGTTGVVCAELGRKFIGIEIDKEYFELAKERITEAHKTQNKKNNE